MAKKKRMKTMAEVTAGYEDFIKKEKIKDQEEKVFEKTLKKALTAKKKDTKK